MPPVIMVILMLQLDCSKGDCVTMMSAIRNRSGGGTMVESGQTLPQPDLSIDVGAFPRDQLDDMEPTLLPFKWPDRNADYLNGSAPPQRPPRTQLAEVPRLPDMVKPSVGQDEESPLDEVEGTGPM